MLWNTNITTDDGVNFCNPTRGQPSVGRLHSLLARYPLVTCQLLLKFSHQHKWNPMFWLFFLILVDIRYRYHSNPGSYSYRYERSTLLPTGIFHDYRCELQLFGRCKLPNFSSRGSLIPMAIWNRRSWEKGFCAVPDDGSWYKQAAKSSMLCIQITEQVSVSLTFISCMLKRYMNSYFNWCN